MPAGWSDIQTQALALSGFLEEANITSADLLAVLEYKRYRGYLVDGIRSYANDLKKRGIIPSVVGNEDLRAEDRFHPIHR
ncbi:hypothetical protein PSEUBRA_002929 [Kalmanozyma brasiliensis GHG001]|uniref:Uncharacterized protein n=1 Tax=Kalmanozyma brasiliensis (strain GHG001) TaxID=1365824 RepID=V5EYI5_KALBG|nr:uncharacterized protein PSEUBRA_002929 [Kalmanozyma brasiliensis GHG001]EST07814.1 hypothetical protein PSEUBRA_002929 [Kalmanozyma brasiliensis GHG001]